MGILITCSTLLYNVTKQRAVNSPATVMVRGPSLEFSPSHNTIVPSTIEASDSEVRVAVRGPLESVRTPRNAGLPRVTSMLLVSKVMVNTCSCGEVTVHRMTLPGRVQVKVTVSSGQDTVEVDVSVAAYKNKDSYSQGSSA